MSDWRRAVLSTLGYKPTPQNLRFLETWQRWEGGHTKNDARFNWLNTTHGSGDKINSVGVKRFKSFQQGIQFTTETLMNGRYDDILDALRSGDPYKYAPTAGLSTWVSGSPTARPDYAAKVLGGKAVARPSSSPTRSAAPPPGASPVLTTPGLSDADETWNWTMDFLNRDRHDQRFLESLKLPEPTPVYTQPQLPKLKVGAAGHEDHGHESIPVLKGKVLNPGTSWSGSHVTDGLDWNNGKKTATDIMAKAGTIVAAPESGTVIRNGSAQGGRSMYFLSDAGNLYWLGHIDGNLPEGTRVKRGQRIAVISADHKAPHLHIDRYYGKNPGEYT